MESFENSNCHSMSDSFSLYERFLRSFNVVNPRIEETVNREQNDCGSIINCDSESSQSRGNIELSIVTSNVINKHNETAEIDLSLLNQVVREHNSDKESSLDTDCVKLHSPCTPLAASLLESSSAAVERSLINDKSNTTDVQISSEESRIEITKHPVFITPTMENSSNAQDSVPMFRQVRPTDSVFKLPISELTFNGTLKHVQKMKPIVDPITALSSSTGLVSLEDKPMEESCGPFASSNSNSHMTESSTSEPRVSDSSEQTSDISDRLDKHSESTGDSQYEERKKDNQVVNDDGSISKWNLEQSSSSIDASFDSGVRSPDMFSDVDDEDAIPDPEPFWTFLKDYENHDKRKVRKIEETLQGVLPPPSVTILKTDVTEMLKKYYCYLPLFNEDANVEPPEINTTPTKRVSFVEIPEKNADAKDIDGPKNFIIDKPRTSISLENSELDTSVNDKTVHLKMCTEVEAIETLWPDVIKCRYHDVYYNVTKHSEKLELLSLRYGERYVGAETDTSVNVYSGGLQSPSSASKRKAMRLKMAQAKSPGRRLSHLARRRQAFASAATIGDKAQVSTNKMVLIDKNFFPHRKLINSSERKSPRTRRTPGKKTPIRKTPGKKTPAKTPKTRSGGSSKKKAMRRLLMDPEHMTRSQPSRETLKRALFISPEHRKSIPSLPSSSVPAQAMKSKRALFGSPDRQAETKSMDGTQSDQFPKRKRDPFDDEPDRHRSKIAKSLSFGGDTIGGSQSFSFARRNSEAFPTTRSVELNEHHKKKLLWAVSEALRVHGWRMSSPGFREKAALLARLTRRLLALPPHAARLAAPKLSTSEVMLKIARQYVFQIIQGRTVDECFQEEKSKLATEATKVSGYISANAYQQMRDRQNAATTFASQIKENTCDSQIKSEQTKSTSKNILQDKLVNIDSNSNSSSGLSMLDRSSLGLFKSNSMPSFEEAAKMRARRQISFDDVDFPKR